LTRPGPCTAAPTSLTEQATVNSFLADGGDAFTVLARGANRLGGGDDLVALPKYPTANSPVAPPPTDRINEVTAPYAPGTPGR
jgi:5'-nucleotidase